jgi:hypothetical protein
MGVNVCLPLFGEPGRELEEDRVKGKHLRSLGDALRERLNKAADLLDRLEAAGWSAQVALYEVTLARADVETREQAERHLRAAGVDPTELMIIEEFDEDPA